MDIRNMAIWRKSKTVQISQIYGTLITLGLLVYFLAMYALGLIHVIELRVLNIFIVIAGIYFALRQYRSTHGGSLDYFRALTVGTATGFIGTTTFGIFLFFFLKFEGNLMASIQQHESIGAYLNPYIASAVVMLEGVFSGFGVSYVLVNFMNTDKATTPQGRRIDDRDKKGMNPAYSRAS